MTSMVLFGDSVFGRKEYKRALSYYKRALQQPKLCSRHNAGMDARISPQQVLQETARVRFRIAKCYMELDETDKIRKAMTMVS